MPFDVLLGLQWGDEGKSKIIDYLAKDYDAVVRFQGGENAGHTVIYKDRKIILHHIPSGIFYPEKINIMANGMVINPLSLIKEMEELKTYGCSFEGRLFISECAAVVLPIHKEIDAKRDEILKIGTTKKGIGPAYEDYIGRRNLTIGDLLCPSLKEKMERIYSCHCSDNFTRDYKDIAEAAEYLREYIADTTAIINNLLKTEKNVLFEGAQGSLLDINHGTYPFVTSSNTTFGGVLTGSGVNPRYMRDVFGLIKAYTTRVGEGAFPTELHDEQGEEIGRVGNEFGATTGRKRRVGWLDLPAVKYAVEISGVNKLIITKIDVLSGVGELSICDKYGDGSRGFSANTNYLETVEPHYKKMNGWDEDISQAKSLEELNSAAKTYVEYIASALDTEVMLLSTGPERNKIIKL